MGVVTRKDSPFYWLTLERPGQRPVRRATKILVHPPTAAQVKENQRLAQLEYHRAMTELAKGRLGLTAPAPSTAPTLRAFVEGRYGVWLASDPGGSSAYETRRRLDRVFLPAFGHLPMNQITPDLVADWRTARLRKVSAHTVDRDLNALRGLISRAVEWRLLSVSPLAGLRMAATPHTEIVRYLSPDEETRLLAALTDRTTAACPALATIVIVALHTGMRRGELFALDWRAVDEAARVITVEGRTAKTKRTRRIPLNVHALTALQRWKPTKAKGLVFPGPTGRKMKTLQFGWSAVLEAAEIEHFRFHDLRHTFASKLVQRGVSLLVVSQLLGHGSLAMTQRYAHLAPEQGRTAVDALCT